MKSAILRAISAVTVFATLNSLAGLIAEAQQQPASGLPTYIVIDLGTLGGTGAVAEGISDRGWVVGTASVSGDQSGHAFLWRDGVMTDLGTLGGPNSSETWPVKDNRGLIAGVAETTLADPLSENFCPFAVENNPPTSPTGLTCLGFLWHDGVMTALPTLGGNNGNAASVNNRGEVAGWAENSTQDPTCVPPQVLDYEAVVWGPGAGEIHALPPLPGDTVSFATGINESGQVVGLSGGCVSPNFNAGGPGLQHGAIWQNGTVTNLESLGGTLGAFPFAINSKGQVVGQSYIAGDIYIHTFLWEKGAIKDLGTVPGDVVSTAFGINDEGEVVGGSCGPNVTLEFGCRAFIWQNGVMTDLNSLVKPGTTPLYLVFGNDINSRGEIAAFAFNPADGEFRAAVAIPCDEEHAGDEVCANSAAGTTTSTQRPNIVLPESVREQLRKRLPFSRFGVGTAGPR